MTVMFYVMPNADFNSNGDIKSAGCHLLAPCLFSTSFCSLLLLFIVLQIHINIYLDSGNAEKNFKQQNKLYL